MRIKDIFTSRDCRRCMRIALKLFFTKLPIVKDICEMRQANKLTKKLVGKDSWERYTIIKKIEDEDGRPLQDVSADTLKLVLSEVLRDLRKEDKCYIKYELKQGCFHITTR